LRRDRGDEGRVSVAEGVDRDAAEEVEVPVAVYVPDVGPLPVGENEPRDAEDADVAPPVPFEEGLLRCGDGAGPGHEGLTSLSSGSASSGRIIVPKPSEVKISRSIECACRPSTTCAWGTPFVTARMHASSLGIMPVATVPRRSRAPEALRWDRREFRSGQSA